MKFFKCYIKKRINNRRIKKDWKISIKLLISQLTISPIQQVDNDKDDDKESYGRVAGISFLPELYESFDIKANIMPDIL